MPFDWQAELASPVSLPSVPVRFVPTAAASTSAIVAQLTAPPKSFAAAVGGSRSPPTEEPPYRYLALKVIPFPYEFSRMNTLKAWKTVNMHYVGD